MTTVELNKLVNDIATANNAAFEYSEISDGGTCNFDTPIMKIKLSRKEREALKDFLTPIGGRYYKDWYYVEVCLFGQGDRRTRMAEAAAEVLENLGYTACVSYQMD